MSTVIEERWVEMPGFSNYIVSNYGNARLVKSPYNVVYSIKPTHPVNLKIFVENDRHFWRLITPNGIKEVEVEKKVSEAFGKEEIMFHYDNADISKDDKDNTEEKAKEESATLVEDPEDDNNSKSAKALDFVTNTDLDLVDSNSAPVDEETPTITISDEPKKGIWRVSDNKTYTSITNLSTTEHIPYTQLRDALKKDGKFEYKGEIYKKA